MSSVSSLLLLLLVGPALPEPPAAERHPGAAIAPTTAASADPAITVGDDELPPGHLAPPAAGAASNELSLEAWQRDDWLLVAPKVSLLEVSGYLRLRGYWLNRLDFGVGDSMDRVGDPVYPDGDRYANLNGGIGRNYQGTSMRLRVEPRINLSETLQIVVMADLLDNLTLGSTPNTLLYRQTEPPVHILSTGQRPPQRNDNGLRDSLVVKRAYGRVTALGEQLELRMGRMPDHWGLGMQYNNGDCLDCDYGTVVDRIVGTFKMYGHAFALMADWVSKGPLIYPFGPLDPAPLDAVPWDDTMQLTARAWRADHPDDIQAQVLRGERVINYGLSARFRKQDEDFGQALYSTPTDSPVAGPGYDPTRPPTAAQTQRSRRDALIFSGDTYGKLYQGKLELGGELAAEWGNFHEFPGTFGASPGESKNIRIMRFGGLAEGLYHLRADHHGARLGFKAGAASGDRAPGFGALDATTSQRRAGDLTVTNFQFSPDYHVDLLLFRRIIGTVTDAWFVRPEFSYRFDNDVATRLAMIYSQAFFSRSTPSGPLGSRAERPMGLELDGELSYALDAPSDRGQFRAALLGGMLFPLGAMDNGAVTAAAGVPGATSRKTEFAWTLQGRLYLTF